MSRRQNRYAKIKKEKEEIASPELRETLYVVQQQNPFYPVIRLQFLIFFSFAISFLLYYFEVLDDVKGYVNPKDDFFEENILYKISYKIFCSLILFTGSELILFSACDVNASWLSSIPLFAEKDNKDENIYNKYLTRKKAKEKILVLKSKQNFRKHRFIGMLLFSTAIFLLPLTPSDFISMTFLIGWSNMMLNASIGIIRTIMFHIIDKSIDNRKKLNELISPFFETRISWKERSLSEIAHDSFWRRTLYHCFSSIDVESTLFLLNLEEKEYVFKGFLNAKKMAKNELHNENISHIFLLNLGYILEKSLNARIIAVNHMRLAMHVPSYKVLKPSIIKTLFKQLNERWQEVVRKFNSVAEIAGSLIRVLGGPEKFRHVIKYVNLNENLLPDFHLVLERCGYVPKEEIAGFEKLLEKLKEWGAQVKVKEVDLRLRIIGCADLDREKLPEYLSNLKKEINPALEEVTTPKLENYRLPMLSLEVRDNQHSWQLPSSAKEPKRKTKSANPRFFQQSETKKFRYEAVFDEELDEKCPLENNPQFSQEDEKIHLELNKSREPIANKYYKVTSPNGGTVYFWWNLPRVIDKHAKEKFKSILARGKVGGPESDGNCIKYLADKKEYEIRDTSQDERPYANLFARGKYYQRDEDNKVIEKRDGIKLYRIYDCETH